MFCLVTGGGGHLGSHLVRALVKRGAKVRVLDKERGLLDSLKDGDFEFVQGGIEDVDTARVAVRGVDVVCHFAYTFTNDPEVAYRINVEGTLNLLNAAKEEGVKHFLHASSVGVIGRPICFPIDETHLCRPKTLFWPLYGVTKYRVEKAVLDFCLKHDLPTTPLRFSLTYSEQQIFTFYDREILDKALRNDVIEVPEGSGADWNHAYDIAQGFMKAALNRKAYGEVFQLASDAYLTWREFAEYIVDWTGSKSRIMEVPLKKWVWSGFSQDPSYDLRCSCEKARRVLGYEPRYVKQRFLKFLKHEAKKRV